MKFNANYASRGIAVVAVTSQSECETISSNITLVPEAKRKGRRGGNEEPLVESVQNLNVVCDWVIARRVKPVWGLSVYVLELG